MTRLPLTVLIHTLNEANQIEDCLRSVEWADEIYLLDSFSTDDTLEVVRRTFPDVRIELRESLGSAAQKNYGMDRASHDWILVIDADERATPELRDEVLEVLSGKPDRWGFRINRRNLVLGKTMNWGLLRWDHVNRLFHRKHARYPNRRVHAELIVDGPTGTLTNPLTHYYVRSFQHMANKMERYGRWSAAQMYLEGKTSGPLQIIINPLWRFLREYVVLAGFLDGVAGLGVAVMHAFYTFQKHLNLWEYRRLAAQGAPVPLPKLDQDEDRWKRPWETSRESRSSSASAPVGDPA